MTLLPVPVDDSKPSGTAGAPKTGAAEFAAEIVNLDRVIAYEKAWAALVLRALEPNPFLDPAFAIPLYRSLKPALRPHFLLIWREGEENESEAERRCLIGFLPIAIPNGFLARHTCAGIVRAGSSAHTPLGTPLLDRTRSYEALSGMAKGLRGAFKNSAGLRLTDLPIKGSTVALLHRYAHIQGTPLVIFNRYERACLAKIEEVPGFPASFISTKRRKFYRQQRRRLNQSGEVASKSFRTAQEVARAAEDFLALEARGWKGRHKTAFLASASEATFFRAATAAMAERGNCRIDSLELEGKPIAMGVILECGEHAFFWKTCFDERFAAFSPGAQLTLDLTRTQLASESITLTDSCAIPDHPMINHIWRQRLAMTGLFLPLRQGHHSFFIALTAWETMHAFLKNAAKTGLKRMKRLLRKRLLHTPGKR
jgi:hypothetical protein